MNIKTELGECDISGLIKVDYAAEHEIGVNNTVVHEFIHNQLCKTTYYGIFLDILNIISKIDKQYVYSVNLLEGKMIWVQEAIATFIQYSSYYRNNEKNKLSDQINRLKRENKKYYKFLKPLVFLFYDDRIDIDDKIRLVMFLAYSIMNIDLTDIDSKILNGKRKLERYITNEHNRYKYLPKIRFNLIVNSLNKYFKETDKLNYEEIEEIILKHSSIPVFQNKDKSLDRIINYMKKLSSESKYSKEIEAVISKMKVVNDELALSGVAIQSLNLYDKEEISYNDYSNMKVTIPIVAFIGIAVNRSGMVQTILNNNENDDNFIDGFSAIFTSITHKKNFLIEDLSINEFLKDKKCIKVIDMVAYFMKEGLIQDLLNDNDQEIYVISSMPYDYISSYLKGFITNTYKYRILEFEDYNFSAIIVHINNRVKVIILIEYIASLKFFDDLATKKCKFEIISTTDEQPYDNYIFRNEDDIFIYNTIVNAYLQTELKNF